MTQDRVINEYFDWLCGIVCRNRYHGDMSFDKLLTYLHSTEFTYSISMDENRADDGIEMRYRYALYLGRQPLDTVDIMEMLDGPCSVLEMMIALAIRCEEEIMDDAAYGDRTGQWFWGMIVNLGLGSMVDSRYNRRLVEERVHRFLNRNYASDGKGGLFKIKNCHRDLREVDLWDQMNLYLNDIT